MQDNLLHTLHKPNFVECSFEVVSGRFKTLSSILKYKKFYKVVQW